MVLAAVVAMAAAVRRAPTDERRLVPRLVVRLETATSTGEADDVHPAFPLALAYVETSDPATFDPSAAVLIRTACCAWLPPRETDKDQVGGNNYVTSVYNNTDRSALFEHHEQSGAHRETIDAKCIAIALKHFRCSHTALKNHFHKQIVSLG